MEPSRGTVLPFTSTDQASTGREHQIGAIPFFVYWIQDVHIEDAAYWVSILQTDTQPLNLPPITTDSPQGFTSGWTIGLMALYCLQTSGG
ncbi:hypothetical protein OCV64_08540 [Muriventricola aceti]|uniref:hypothetical protein n=1 Tax=Flintibacter sp. HCN-6482 TaxID=3134672 RepID=UPI001FAC5C5C|nr:MULTISPECIES: hypothetical protein [Eubacteriales]MCU6702856.1 hypothetical protein [Muriventricola aceti]